MDLEFDCSKDKSTSLSRAVLDTTDELVAQNSFVVVLRIA